MPPVQLVSDATCGTQRVHGSPRDGLAAEGGQARTTAMLPIGDSWGGRPDAAASMGVLAGCGTWHAPAPPPAIAPLSRGSSPAASPASVSVSFAMYSTAPFELDSISFGPRPTQNPAGRHPLQKDSGIAGARKPLARRTAEASVGVDCTQRLQTAGRRGHLARGDGAGFPPPATVTRPPRTRLKTRRYFRELRRTARPKERPARCRRATRGVGRRRRGVCA